MNKIILMPIATIKGEDEGLYLGVKELFAKLISDGNKIVIVSHDANKLKQIKEEFHFVSTKRRHEIKNFVKELGSERFIFVGGHDQDLISAANNKILFVNPLWSYVQEEKAVRYGIGIKSLEGLYKFIRIQNNQKSWYYKLAIDNKSSVYSLIRANTHAYYLKSDNEKELVEGFEDVLKRGNKRYFKVLLYHFLASITNSAEFKEVDYWSIMPSSGITLNEDMWHFKERVRIVMGKKKRDPLFVRHTPAQKSHNLPDRDRLPCKRHFDTVIINPEYKGKLKGRTVCVLDDYLTNGTSFESIRNLLMYAGVKKVIFVSIGRFKKSPSKSEYLQQNYKLSGDIFTPNYSYETVIDKELQGIYNNEAIDDIEKLYKIIYS